MNGKKPFKTVNSIYGPGNALCSVKVAIHYAVDHGHFFGYVALFSDKRRRDYIIRGVTLDFQAPFFVFYGSIVSHNALILNVHRRKHNILTRSRRRRTLIGCCVAKNVSTGVFY
jgi:hypothetical protein